MNALTLEWHARHHDSLDRTTTTPPRDDGTRRERYIWHCTCGASANTGHFYIGPR